MEAHPVTHPPADSLRAFGLGKLAPGQAEAVARHLGDCDACRRLLEGLPPDSFVGLVKAAHGKPVSAPAESRLGSAGLGGPAGPVAGLPAELVDHPKFRVLRLLGRGGMGTVYQARHTLMDRDVALKVINPALVDHPEAVERFRAEVRALARLSHPHFVQALDAEQAGNLHILVMEFVDGVSLDRLLERSGPRPVDQACRFIAQAAAGLQHAHEQGMVHRDLKPQNLMVTREGKVKVLDLGLTRLARGQPGRGLTQADAFMGTPEYVAPEQAADARSADIRSDVYSLGCTLYCLLAGRPPFVEPTAVKAILAHLEKEPEPLPRLRPDVPEALWAVVARMLAKDPARRFQTPIELARALAPFCRPGVRREAGGGPPPLPGVESPGRGTVIGGDTSKLRAILREVPGKTPAGEAPAKDETANPFGGLREAAAPPKKVKSARKPARPAQAAWWKRPAVPGGAAAVVLALVLVAVWASGVLTVKTTNEPVQGPGEADPPKREAIPPDLLALAGSDPTQVPPELVAVLGEGRLNHWGPINSLSFSPDGKTLASGSVDGTARLWDVTDGRLQRSLEEDEPDGRSQAGRREQPTQGSLVRPVVFSPDGRTLATGSGDGLVRLWDVDTGRLRRVLDQQGGWIAAVAFSPDSQQVAAAVYGPAAVKVWAVATGQLRRSFDTPMEKVCGVAFSPDGKTLAAGGGRWWGPEHSRGRVKLWDLSTDTVRAEFEGHTSLLTGLVFSPDGKMLATSSWDGTLRLWKVETGQEVHTLRHGNWVLGMAFSPDGKTVASSRAFDGSIRVWDILTGDIRFVIQADFRTEVVAFSPDGRTLASGTLDGMVRLWDVATRRERAASHQHKTSVNHLAICPDGKTLVSGGNEPHLRLWNVATGRQKRVLEGHSGAVYATAVSPDGRVLASGSGDRVVRLWDLATGRTLKTLAGHEREVAALAFSHDGQLVASGGCDTMVRLWDVATGEGWLRLAGHDAPVRSVAFSPDRKTLASGGEDKTVKLWEVTTGKLRSTLEGHTAAVRSVTFAADGRTLISAGDDKTVRLWDLAKEQVRLTLDNGERITSIALSPDGQTLAAAGGDGQVRLRDAANGRPRETIRVGPRWGVVNQVAFTPDGHHLVTANGNGTIYILRLPRPQTKGPKQ